MGRRQMFLLLLVLCVFASFVSAQSASVEFLDEWGEATSRVLEQSRVLLRVIDPAANTTSGRDSVAVDLSAVNGPDTATVSLAESGDATGVFEGEAFLTTDYALDNIEGVDADQLYTTWYYAPELTLDTATATYGAASDSVQVDVSETLLVDGEGRGTETVTLGEPVRVRVRDAYADRSSGPDLTTATLTTSGGGSQVVTLTETGAHTRTFEGSTHIQTAIDETVTVTHVDLATGASPSSDSALVAGASVSFVRPRDGRTTDLLLANSAIVVRVTDVSRNLDPAAVESLGVSIAMVLGEDYEFITLHETGPDTGVFEGAIRHTTNFPTPGNELLESSSDLVPAHLDTVRVQHESSPYASGAEAPMTVSTTRLVDENGADSESFALGSDLRVEVETAAEYSSPFLDTRNVEVRSLTTGDLETLRLAETDGRDYLFKGTIPVVSGTAVAGDRRLQAQPGETVEVVHDVYGVASSDRATVARSAVRFVDEAGLPVKVLVEESTAWVRVLDPLSAGQAPPVAAIRSRITDDVEPLGLAELAASPGLFEGSIPMRLWDWSSGILGTGREYPATREPDTITASAGQAAASLLMMPAILEVVDGQGEPRATASAGDTLTLRAIAPRADTAPYPESFAAVATSALGGDWQYVWLTETGDSTGIFEGTVDTVRAGTAGTEPIEVELTDRVEVVYNASDYPDDPNGRVTAVVAIVPTAVQLLDDQGEAAASYVFGDDIHVRVVEPAANADPAVAEALTVTVSSHRYGDAKSDLETVTLAETGPDTGVFTGALPTDVLLDYSAYPVAGDGLLQLPEFVQEPDNDSKVTATRNGASATARIRDSKLWLADDQGQDADSFAVGSTIQVWMRWPVGNTTPGVETVLVSLEVRGLAGVGDTVYQTLTETGGDTGLFTAQVPTGPLPHTYDGALQAQAGDLLFAQRSYYHLYSFDTAVFTEGGTPSNQPPDAVDDAVSMDEDTQVVIAVKANDSDPDGDPLAVTSATPGTRGGVAIEADGTITYTPSLNFQGTDAFTYTVSDNNGGTDTATVFITVNPVNDPPNANNDSATTPEDTAITVAILANDTDADGDLLTAGNLSAVTNGTLVLNPDGTATYTPDPDFRGFENFTYTATDPSGAQDTATVFLEVTAVNDPPTAVNDAATTNEDTALNFDVASNDTDPDGDALSVIAVTQGANGSVVINNSPSLNGKYVIYTPSSNVNGSDSFTYTISDGKGGTATATVAMTVTPVNDAPLALNDSIATSEDTPVTFDPRINDSDVDGHPLTVTFVSFANRGTAVINADGTVTYTPGANVSGSDSFLYDISDGQGGTDRGVVSVTVTPVNDPPVANNDIPSVQEDTPVTINVLSNDSDIDGDTLTVTLLTQPTHGTAVLNPDQTVTYTPELNYSSGTDTFTYSVSDGNGGTDPATVYLNVAPVNDPPVANADTATVAEEGTVTIPVAANDNDPDGGALTLVSATQGAHGTVTVLADNQVSYQPAANYAGPDTFTYTVRDPASLTATGTVSVTVTPVNDPPVANADSAATDEDTPVAVPVLANDADVDGGALSVSNVTQGSSGVVTTDGATVTYTPAAGFSGADSFTYNVSDGNGGTSTALVTISVAAVNDAPVAAPDSGSTGEGVPVIIPVLANDTDEEGNTLTVTAVEAPGVPLPDDTVQYTPGANFTGTVTFGYTVSDGQGGTADGQVTVVVGEALERVAILATNSAWLRSGAVVLSGDVIVNQASAGPYLNGAELSLGGSVTTAAGWDVEADSLTVAAGAVIGGDVSYNQLTSDGTIDGLQRSPLALPVFPALPAFLTAAPGGSNVNVGNNGTRTLAPGSYLDLVVGRKGTVTFTGGVYHFRSIRIDREAKLLFEDASEVRVQQKLSTKNLTTVGPAAGASIDASAIVFYVAGINGTGGGLAETPKAVEIGVDNVLSLNLYAPNGTTWLQDGSLAIGAFLGKDIDVGLNVQVTLDSAY